MTTRLRIGTLGRRTISGARRLRGSACKNPSRHPPSYRLLSFQEYEKTCPRWKVLGLRKWQSLRFDSSLRQIEWLGCKNTSLTRTRPPQLVDRSLTGGVSPDEIRRQFIRHRVKEISKWLISAVHRRCKTPKYYVWYRRS